MPDVIGTGNNVSSNAAPGAAANSGQPSQGLAPTPGVDDGQGQPARKLAPTIEQAKAQRRLANQGSQGTGAGSGTGGMGSQDQAGQGTGADTGTVQPEAKKPDPTLDAFLSLRKDIDKHQKQFQEIQPIVELGRKFEQAQALIAQGKNFEAIQLLGADFNQAVAEVMEIEKPENKAKSELDQIKARQDKIDQELKERDQAAAKARAQAERESGVKEIQGWVKANAAKFPFLAKSDAWIEQALVKADSAYADALKQLKEQGEDRDLTIEERNGLILSALSHGEKFRAEEAKLYGLSQPAPAQRPNQAPTRNATVTHDVRGGIRMVPAAPVRKGTREEAKAARRQSQV